jgi:hypothetical protein
MEEVQYPDKIRGGADEHDEVVIDDFTRIEHD